MPAPDIGSVHDGYRYNGGDPNAKGSWSYVGASQVAGSAAVSNPSAPGSYLMTPGAIPKLLASTEEELAKGRAASNQAMQALSDARRFRALNEKAKSGGLSGFGWIKDVRVKTDPLAAEMNAISERLVPQNREPGSGAMSDSDVAMYRAATIGLDKPKEANDAMSRVIGAGAIRTSDRNAFMEEWARRNGSLLGAQEAWSQYAAANPLFKNGAKGNTEVLGWTPWRQWFGVEQAKPGGQMAPKAAAPAAGGFRFLGVEE